MEFECCLFLSKSTLLRPRVQYGHTVLFLTNRIAKILYVNENRISDILFTIVTFERQLRDCQPSNLRDLGNTLSVKEM